MNIKTRRIIMFSFILAFFILAPTLIFYASGYRVDINRKKILRTGTLMIGAKDIKDANIYINNQLYEKALDEKIFIYNLLPGDYEIKLEKAGYHPWQKKISINSSLTTFAKDIILFKKQVPLQIIEGNVLNFYLSPDQQKIVYLIETDSFWQIYYTDVKNQEKELVYRIPAQSGEINVSWAASSKKFLLQASEKYLIFDIKNLKQSQAIENFTSLTPLKVKWDIQSDNLIYLATDNSVYEIDILAKSTKLLLKTKNNILNPEFFIEANDIFYILRSENKDIIYKYNLSYQTNKIVFELNKSNNYKFIETRNNYITLLDLDNQKLFLIKKILNGFDIRIKTETVKQFSAKDAQWNKNEKQLLIYDDFEIHTYNTETDEQSFINRYGQEIAKTVWYPNMQYILVLFDNYIKIIDLFSTNGTRNVTEIIKFEKITNFHLDEEGENIYFNGIIGKQQGVYILEIKK